MRAQSAGRRPPWWARPRRRSASLPGRRTPPRRGLGQMLDRAVEVELHVGLARVEGLASRRDGISQSQASFTASSTCLASASNTGSKSCRHRSPPTPSVCVTEVGVHRADRRRAGSHCGEAVDARVAPVRPDRGVRRLEPLHRGDEAAALLLHPAAVAVGVVVGHRHEGLERVLAQLRLCSSGRR